MMAMLFLVLQGYQGAEQRILGASLK